METLNKEQLADAYKAVWGTDKRMIDHCVKSSGTNLMTDDGLIWDIDKPSIQTNFCFGEHGYDYEEVNRTCNALSKDERYFKTENIRRMEAYRLLKSLREYPERFYWAEAYSGDSSFVHLNYYWHYNELERERFAIRQITNSEIEEVVSLLKEEIRKFNKRINTYLKRYGLSKCRYWTYWAEA